ncbi:MAG: dephospho-CoA kinase [Spirulinaceae cyanobacterium]
MNQKRIIGLTGGIATGKTTVADYLAQAYKLPILDADLFAREAVQIGSPVLEKIFQRYGNKIQLTDGRLNRSKLGEIVFSNPEERHWLEAQIHPYVRECFVEALKYLSQPEVVLVIPLLLEANMMDLVTEIWVVICSEEEQLRRLVQRNRLSVKDSQERINSQLPLEEKIAIADVVLNNTGNRDYLLQQIDLVTKN